MASALPQPLADVLEARREEVLRRWTERLLRQQAQGLPPRPDLTDALPRRLDALIAGLRQPRGEEGPAGFAAPAPAREYALLWEVLLDVLEETGYPLRASEVRALSEVLVAAAAGAAVRHELAPEREALERTTEALRKNEQRLQGLLDAAAEGIYGVDKHGRCTFANRACARLLGYGQPEELVGLLIHELIHHTRPDGHIYPKEKCRMYQAFREGVPTDVDDEIFWRADGTSFPVHYRSSPILEQGQMVGAVAVFEDITERQRAAEAARERAEFAEQLVGITSHDLRTPLNAISLSAAALLRRGDLDEHVRKNITRVQSSAGRAARMVRDLLDFTQARLGHGIPLVPRPLDFHALVAQLVQEVGLACPQRHLEFLHDGDAKGEWDPDRLAQVVSNLVNNALAYSPPDTPVRVETHGARGEVVLHVHNVGEPISPELMPHLFEPMKRGRPDAGHAERSVGLGLFIVKHIVRRHGGRVEVRSDAREGTTFTVRLPRRPP